MKRFSLIFCLFALILIARCDEKKCEEGIDATGFASSDKMKGDEGENTGKLGVSKDFGEWMHSHDVQSREKIRFSTSNEPFVGHVGVARMHALKDLKKGEPIYNFPVMAMISAHEARNDEIVGATFKELSEPQTKKEEEESRGRKKKALTLTDPEIVKMYSIWLKHNQNSSLKPYFDILPREFDTPLQWSEAELEELKGSPLYEYTHQLAESVNDDYTHVIKKVIQKYPTVFPEDVFTLNEWKWATSLLGGRVWRVGKESVIFPLIETFNFVEEPSASIEFKDNIITLTASKDILKGEKIHVCFTDNKMGNRELLDFYGMMLPSNPHDNVRVGVSIKEDDQLFKGKTRALKERGLKSSQFYSMEKGGPSKDLVFALRMYYSTVYDFDSLAKAKIGKALSHQNELEVTKALIELCQAGLREYPTTSKEDGEILKKPNLSIRKKRAIALRRAEKKIFLQTIKQAKNVMASTKANWDMRGMDIPLNIKPIKKE